MRVIDQAEADRLAERHLQGFIVDGDAEARVRLEDASLSGIRFSSGLMRASFAGCRLEEVDFSGANLDEAAFDRCTLERCDLSQLPAGRLWAEETVFKDCRLGGSYFGRAHLKAARLESCDLAGATLANVFAVGAGFAGSRLDGCDFELAWLDSADFRGASMAGSRFRRARLSNAALAGLDLTGVELAEADLRHADLGGSVLRRAGLAAADLRGASLRGASLEEADLSHANLAAADLAGADLTGARVYGIAAWDLVTDEATRQKDLVVTPPEAPLMSVDDVEVAQFIYLILNRAKLRQVIDTITSRAVLILGRFRPPERKAVLDAVAAELRRHRLLPILFDFERSRARDFTETIQTLAGMSLFVVADITNPKSSPLELQATVPDYQIPFVPIIQRGDPPFSMFADLRGKYDWVLEPLEYPSVDKLVAVFKPAVIDRAWQKHQELLERKGRTVQVLSVEQFLEDDEPEGG